MIRIKNFPCRDVNVFIAMLLLVFFASLAVAQPPKSVPPSERIGDYKDLSKEQKAMLDDLEKRTFEWFRDSENPKIGVTPDHWDGSAGGEGEYFASIASSGFGLTAYGIAVERGWMKRGDAVQRTLTTLRFFHNAPQSDDADATGNHGFYYHFLDMQTGHRYGPKTWVELSTVDTTWLIAGALFAQSYYDKNTKEEKEIRQLADDIYRRADWAWASPRQPLVAMGWTPEANFIHADWQGYDEAMMLYVLAIGSPTHAVDPAAWKAWTQTYDASWGSFQGQEHLGFAPMFGHQYSHVWIDFRGIQDDYMRSHGIDYYTNSQRAALSQREYAIHNPMDWSGYGSNVWGLSACNGPRRGLMAGEVDRYKNDKKTFYGYIARGAGLVRTIDDGTIAPTAAASSIAFVPELAIPAIAEMKKDWGDNVYDKYGFVDAFNPSFTYTDRPLRTGKVVPDVGWFDTMHIGIDQGPIVAMIENYRSDFVWKTMRKNPYIRDGLKKAGFTGGWLDQPVKPAKK